MGIIPQSTDVPDLSIIMSKDCSFDSHISSLSSICNNLTNVPDLGIIMSKDCSFDSHISSLSRKCKNLAGWILRSFVSRDKLTTC